MDKSEKQNTNPGTSTDVEMCAESSEAFNNGGLKRDLSSRHINMIAVTGMIDTGLFLSSGQVIATAGLAGALLAYTVMGFVTAGVAYTTGEITAFMPETGGFIRHATKFVGPALGAATGWNFWYTMAITVPAEISAAATLIQFWNTSINPGVWITIFLVFIIGLNLCGVRLYGESEVIFASLKIMLIIGLIIGGLIIDLGGAPNRERLGFRYWDEPGAFNAFIKTGSAGNFLAFWKCMLPAAFSYGNIQIVAISGSEARDPQRLIPAATKKTFYRIFFFYFFSIFAVGLIVPSLQESATAVCVLGDASDGVLGYDVFVKGRFTAEGFITCYLNLAIFAVLYLVFKIRLGSKILKTSEIDFSREFMLIEEERRNEGGLQESRTGE
ncbi:hypothetical protein ACJZ2D_013117 [Fusarium nematophilum]